MLLNVLILRRMLTAGVTSGLKAGILVAAVLVLSLIHISEPTRPY